MSDGTAGLGSKAQPGEIDLTGEVGNQFAVVEPGFRQINKYGHTGTAFDLPADPVEVIGGQRAAVGNKESNIFAIALGVGRKESHVGLQGEQAVQGGRKLFFFVLPLSRMPGR